MSALYIDVDDETKHDFEDFVKYEKAKGNKSSKKSLFSSMFKMYQKTSSYKDFLKFKESEFCQSAKKVSA